MIATLCLSLLLGQASPRFDARADELFRWIDGLGFTESVSKPFVAVKSKESDGRIDAFGFLTAESPTEFKILDLGLIERTFRPADYTHPVYDLKALATVLVQKRDTDYTMMDHPELSGALQIYDLDATIPWMLHHHGLDDVAAKLIAKDEAYFDDSIKQTHEKLDYGQIEKDSISGAILGSLFKQFNDPSISREQMLPAFQASISKFQGCAGSKDFQAATSLLETMVKEDIAHSAKPMPTNPTRNQKIAELIWQFRDASDRNAYEKSAPRNQVVEFGTEAVPQLIDALQDQRFTRSMWFQDSGPPSAPDARRVIRVRDIARTALETIAHRSFWESGMPDYKVVQANARKWYEEMKTGSELSMLVAGTLKGDSNSPAQAKALAEKYPAKAMPAIESAYGKIKDAHQRCSLIAAVEPLPASAKIGFLRTVIRSDKDLTPRIEAIKALTPLAADEGLQDMAKVWKQIDPNDEFVEGSDAVVGFLIGSDRPEGIQAVSEGLSSRNANQRQQALFCLMSGLDHNYDFNFPTQKTPRPTEHQLNAYSRAAEDLLCSELDDKDRWSGSMSLGDVSFSTPVIGELACYALAKCFPGVYQFTPSGSPSVQSQEELSSLNVYRLRRGLPRLSSKEAAAAPNPCTLTSVSSGTDLNAAEKAMVQRIESIKGQTLTADKILGLIETVSKAIANGSTRSASLSIERGSDGTGIAVRIKYRANRLQGAASINLNGEGIRGMGGGDARSFIGKQDDYLPSGIRRCLDTSPAQPFVIFYEIPKP